MLHPEKTFYKVPHHPSSTYGVGGKSPNQNFNFRVECIHTFTSRKYPKFEGIVREEGKVLFC